MPLKRIIPAIIFLCCYSILSAQRSPIDSLNIALQYCKTDSDKIKILNALCSEYVNSFHPDSALKFGFAAEKLADKTGQNKEKAKALMRIGKAYSLQDISAKALSYTSQAQKLYKKMGDKHNVALTVDQMGSIYEHQGDYGSAIRYYTKTIELPTDAEYDKTRALLEENLGNTCQEQGDFDLAITHFRAALKILERTPDNLQSARILKEIGITYVFELKTAPALATFEKARNILVSTPHNTEESASLMLYVGLAYSAKDSLKALTWSIRALEIINRLHNKLNAINAYIESGLISAHFKDTTTAMQYYSEAIRMSDESNYPRGKAMAGVYLASMLPNKDSAKKIHYYTDALATQKRLHVWTDNAFTLQQVANFYYALPGNVDQRFKYSKMAVDSLINAYVLYKNMDNLLGAANSAYSIGEISIANHLPVQALTYYSKAYKIFKRYNCMNSAMTRTTERLGYTYFLKGEFSRAYDLIYKAQQLQEDSGYRQDLWLTYKHKAMYFRAQNNIKIALQYYQKAFDSAKAVNEKKALPSIDFEMAGVYLSIYDTNMALEHFISSEKESEDVRNNTEIANAIYHVANIYYRRKRYSDAEKQYMGCINAANLANDNPLLMYCYYELYQLYLTTGQSAAASQAYDNYRNILKTLPPTER